MRVIYHNWSAMKQRPHPQSVAEISHHSQINLSNTVLLCYVFKNLMSVPATSVSELRSCGADNNTTSELYVTTVV